MSNNSILSEEKKEILVRRLSPACGAEIIGLDLSVPLTSDQVKWLREEMIKHQVLIFRGQEMLTPLQQKSFAEQWGPVCETSFKLATKPSIDGAPHADEVSKTNGMLIFENTKQNAVGRGNIWHTDVSYQTRPPTFTCLHARKIPALGGDTLFLNMYAALESLPEKLRQQIISDDHPSLKAIHDGDAFLKRLKLQTLDEEKKKTVVLADKTNTAHPLVMKHPESMKDTLYFNFDLVTSIEGLSEPESDKLITQLKAAIVEVEENKYRHKWQLHDLLLWDNRCLMHYASYDYGTAERLMYRCTTE